MEVFTEQFGVFVSGFWVSVGICVASLVGSLILGTLIAICRISPIGPLRAFGTAWVNIIRNCPLTVVLFMMAFGLPELGVSTRDWAVPEIGITNGYWYYGVLGLVVYTSTFVCEALRSGVNAVPAGQAEAARAIGLTFSQSLVKVIMPQAFRSAIPPLASVIIAMFKNSAVMGAFGVGGELFSVSDTLTSAQGYAATPVLLGVAVGYLLITLPSAALLKVIERKAVILR